MNIAPIIFVFLDDRRFFISILGDTRLTILKKLQLMYCTMKLSVLILHKTMAMKGRFFIRIDAYIVMRSSHVGIRINL